MTSPQYEHIQKCPLYLLYFVPGVSVLVIACLFWRLPAAMIMLSIVGCVFVLGGFSFQTLTVRDEGDHLAVRFGPLPLMGTRIPYSKITGAEAARSSILDGWGIHWLPGRGWTYNLSGFDCIKLSIGRKIVRIGTDDAEELLAFLETKIAGRNGET